MPVAGGMDNLKYINILKTDKICIPIQPTCIDNGEQIHTQSLQPSNSAKHACAALRCAAACAPYK